MKHLISLLIFLSTTSSLFAQKLKMETLLQDKISIRAIEIWNNRVYYSGTESKFGYVSLKDSADRKQIRLSGDKLQFRTLAQDRNTFYTISIESPAQFFRIDKKSLENRIIYTDTVKNAFYDALIYSNGMFYTFSDPNPDLKLKFAEFNYWNENFVSKFYTEPQLKEGEAAFAASNTNIAASNRYLWIATGGKSSRILRLDRKNRNFEIFETPFIQGTVSQGIYSIDFYKDKFGIAAGGDYTQQEANFNNIATTDNAGKTWQIQASGKNAGYTTCVKIRPGSKGKEIIAVGDRHISYSKDFGKTWKVISKEKGFYVAEWLNRKTVILAGKDRIVMANFVF